MNRLQKLRKAKKLTQEQLAQQSGVPLGTIQKIEHGANDIQNIHVDTALKLARALGTTAEDLAQPTKKSARQ